MTSTKRKMTKTAKPAPRDHVYRLVYADGRGEEIVISRGFSVLGGGALQLWPAGGEGRTVRTLAPSVWAELIELSHQETDEADDLPASADEGALHG